MISRERLAELATRFQTTELNVRREYFQHLFLSYFYQQPVTSDVLFKGGTALRVLFDSPRFSEDLDFTSVLHNVAIVEDVILETLADMARENIAVDITESTQTSGGYLGIIQFHADNIPVSIQLELSFRDTDKRGTPATIASGFLPAYTLVAMETGQLIDEKIEALIDRRKARDFYDLYFVLRANLLPPARRNVLPRALAVLQEVDISFEKELKEFLPRSHWAIIRGFPGTLAREIERFL